MWGGSAGRNTARTGGGLPPEDGGDEGRAFGNRARNSHKQDHGPGPNPEGREDELQKFQHVPLAPKCRNRGVRKIHPRPLRAAHMQLRHAVERRLNRVVLEERAYGAKRCDGGLIVIDLR